MNRYKCLNQEIHFYLGLSCICVIVKILKEHSIRNVSDQRLDQMAFKPRRVIAL